MIAMEIGKLNLWARNHELREKGCPQTQYPYQYHKVNNFCLSIPVLNYNVIKLLMHLSILCPSQGKSEEKVGI